MTREEARQALDAANKAVATASIILRLERATMQQLLAEDRDVDTIMPIVDPTFWMNRERRAVASAIVPIYRAAIAFLDAYEQHTAKLLDEMVSQDPGAAQ